jgi:hypothetical protein
MDERTDPGARELLEKYNPVLVMLPQDFSRRRPREEWWALRDQLRGDFHPCSAEFFLSHVIVRPRARPWLDKILGKEPSVEAIGITRLKELVRKHGRHATLNWEVDLGEIQSQHPGSAWTRYHKMVKDWPGAFESTVYGRCVSYGDSTVLQYWYLYAYNDAGNYHEGDWENVAIELDGTETPVRAGYSSHQSGDLRPWDKVEKLGERPVVNVAKGSHAAYFEHRPQGHRTHSFSAPKGWPEPMEWMWRKVHSVLVTLIFVLKLNDRTAERPDVDFPARITVGEFVRPLLKSLPRVEAVTIDDEFWWMMIRCRWGSRHSRVRGTAAPNPPWEQQPKYDDPLQWLDGLDK